MLYAGLMLTTEGPRVIEYNVRFGDPEAEVVLPLLASDPAELFLAVANGDLEAQRATAFSGDAVCVVMASQGYPSTRSWATPSRACCRRVSRSLPSRGPPSSRRDPASRPDGPFHTAGGPVLGVTAVAPTLARA